MKPSSGREARTNRDRLDLDAFLDVRGIGVVGLLVGENALSAKGVDKGGSAWGPSC
jgi:hypothetical protein